MIQEYKLSSASEVEDCLAGLGEDALFRGQVRHYPSSSGGASIVSSQGRNGCIPELLFKWTHYASEILRVLGGDLSAKVDPDLAQAVLQHYGWRSFFVDLSSDYSVAAWFASYSFSKEPQFTLAEDCFEGPLFISHEVASYTPFDGDGHIYVISREGLSRAAVNCIDLQEVIAVDFQARFKAQSAWLAGPLTGSQPLPSSCIMAHVSAPAQELAMVASKHGFREVYDLFPRREEDFVLGLLLKVPRRRLRTDGEIEVYYPDLVIPEYDFRVVKRFSPTFAFYKEFWIADGRGKSNLFDFTPLKDTLFVRVEDGMLYLGRSWGERMRFPSVLERLRQHQSVAIESRGIVKIVGPGKDYEYSKGLYLRLITDSVVEVGELIVEHPGTAVTGAGINRGWYYSIEADGTWVHTEREDQCPCKNIVRHLRHLWSLQRVEGMLAQGQVQGNRSKDISFLEHEIESR